VASRRRQPSFSLRLGLAKLGEPLLLVGNPLRLLVTGFVAVQLVLPRIGRIGGLEAFALIFVPSSCFMMIVAGDVPDFRTISDFRKRHSATCASFTSPAALHSFKTCARTLGGCLLDPPRRVDAARIAVQ
jgi:hypothetical protein